MYTKNSAYLLLTIVTSAAASEHTPETMKQYMALCKCLAEQMLPYHLQIGGPTMESEELASLNQLLITLEIIDTPLEKSDPMVPSMALFKSIFCTTKARPKNALVKCLKTMREIDTKKPISID